MWNHGLYLTLLVCLCSGCPLDSAEQLAELQAQAAADTDGGSADAWWSLIEQYALANNGRERRPWPGAEQACSIYPGMKKPAEGELQIDGRHYPPRGTPMAMVHVVFGFPAEGSQPRRGFNSAAENYIFTAPCKRGSSEQCDVFVELEYAAFDIEACQGWHQGLPPVQRFCTPGYSLSSIKISTTYLDCWRYRTDAMPDAMSAANILDVHLEPE